MIPVFVPRFHGFGLAVLLLLSSSEIAVAAGKVSFNRDVRPILSDQCFACHGFDAKKRKADLRLDQPEGAYKANDEGVAAVKPGDLKASSLWQRVTTTDEDDIMPPPESHKKLTAEQRDILKRWIEEGAAYEAHWSFIPPAKHEAPKIQSTKYKSQNPLDGFILARLGEEGLQQNEEADKETLIRRVTLDLSGLPPTVAEVDAFLGDHSPMAYERVVERLLKSPRYGERDAGEERQPHPVAGLEGERHDRDREPDDRAP